MKSVRRLALSGLAYCLGSAAAASGATFPEALQTGAILQSQRFGGIVDARIAARIAASRQAWIASGPSLPDDVTQPTLVSGKILTQQLDANAAPAAPAVQVKYATGSAGLSEIDIQFDSPTGQVAYLSYHVDTYAPITTAGKLTIQQPTSNNIFAESSSAIGHYAAPGSWTMVQAVVADKSGASTYYSGADQLGAIFRTISFTVTNTGSPDVQPPTVTAGRILTRTVSLGAASPVFIATLSGTDDLSGIVSGLIFISAPGGNGGFAYTSTLAAPTDAGALTVYNPIYPGEPTGQWSITGYELCDVAGNCLSDSSAADIKALFKTTTFMVTN